MKTKNQKQRILLLLLCIAISYAVIIHASLSLVNDIRSERDLINEEYNNTIDRLSLAQEALNSSNVNNYELKEVNKELEIQIEEMRLELDRIANEYEEYINQSNYLRDIPLDKKYQEYIYNMCVELDLDYNLALAKISLESNFDINARGYNKDNEGNVKSTDYGLCQVNSNNLEWVNELCEREIDVINNVYDNIEAGLRIYKYYESYWSSRGYVDRELDYRSLNSYNRGLSGFKSYMDKGNDYDDWIYGKLVMDRLEEVKGE